MTCSVERGQKDCNIVVRYMCPVGEVCMESGAANGKLFVYGKRYCQYFSYFEAPKHLPLTNLTFSDCCCLLIASNIPFIQQHSYAYVYIMYLTPRLIGMEGIIRDMLGSLLTTLPSGTGGAWIVVEDLNQSIAPRVSLKRSLITRSP